MAEESEAKTTTFDYHHQQVETATDVDIIAKDCLRHDVFTEILGRSSKEVPDLLIARLDKLKSTQALAEYKEKVAKMGIRGVIELQRRAENETAESEMMPELDDDDELRIESESVVRHADEDEDTWLDLED